MTVKNIALFESTHFDSELTKSVTCLREFAQRIEMKLLTEQLKDQLDNLLIDIYCDAYCVLDDDNLISNSENFVSILLAIETVNKEAVKNESFVMSQSMFDRVQAAVSDILKKQLSKKATEKLNYKLF